MPTYEFRCLSCEHITNEVMTIKSTREDKAKIKCEKCGGNTEQTFTETGGFVFKENQEHGESAKPGSYWRNAEKVKQEAIKKRQAIEKEKLAYGDKQAVAKEQRRQANQKQFEDGI